MLNKGLCECRGSFVLSRLANYYPERFIKFCWMDVGYAVPTGKVWDTDAIDKIAEQILGAPIFGYWHFFNDEDAGPLMERDVSFPFSHLLFSALRRESTSTTYFSFHLL